MARWVKTQVHVVWDRAGSPIRLLIAGQGRSIPVEQCLERWRECGEWWNGETEREVRRLLLQGGAVVEVSGPLRHAVTGASGGESRDIWCIDTWFD